MRVTLPVESHFKTLREAAGLNLVRKHTSIPVPKVIALNTSQGIDDEVGFEWILMEFVPGTTLETAWKSIDWNAKCKVVEGVAQISAELFRLQCETIGNVYQVGILVCHLDLLGTACLLAMCSTACAEWLKAILAHKEHDCDQAERKVAESGPDPDSDSKDEVEETRKLIHRLTEAMPGFLPSTNDETDKFAFRHDDLHSRNLMANAAGQLTALVDWKCVSIVPL